MQIIIKAAKKSLKKQEDGQMKLKELVKAVASKVGEDVATEKQVKEAIKASSKFQLDGKIVTLKRKRSSSPSSSSSDNNNNKEQEEKSSAKKKSKSTDNVTTTTKNSANGGGDVLDFESVKEWRQANKIVVMHCNDEEKEKTKELNQANSYFPFTGFTSESCIETINGALLKQCAEVNKFQKPSPIQAQSWPILCKNSDMVGIAETGSGKTLAFSLPILSRMVQNKSTNKKRLPRLLVLSPTRELAMQSDQVLQEFGAVVGITSLVVYGGIPKHTQTSALSKQNVDCIVATPGRLKDLINEGSCDLSGICHLVLDEADRMLDMGFEEDVRFIISQCTPKEKRQTAMFSATWPAAIQNIAVEYMKNPIRVYVGFESIVGSNGDSSIDDSLSANRRVKQTVEVIEDRQRDARLRQLLKQLQAGSRKKDRILIFALYKKEAERIELSLKRDGYDVCSIHGNKNQVARTEALENFKSGKCPLLVATDVAARGLDIPNVEAVINYTFPLTIEDYVHRIGRTGRAGKTGESYTFFQPTDKSHAGELQQVLRQVGQDVPPELEKFGSTIKKKEHKLYGNFGPRTDIPMPKAKKITFNYDDDQ